MGAALSWLLVAGAIVLIGPARPVTAGQHARAGRRAHRRRPSPRALAVTAAAATAAACVSVIGPLPGVVAAALFGPVAAVLVRRLAERPTRAGPSRALPLALDLASATLRGGQSVATAFALTAPLLPRPLAQQWQRAAGLLALGAPAEQAWAALAEDAELAPVAVAARRSADSGVRLARALTQLATDTRARLRAAALARAGRAGVLVLAPLGLCFLPAFVCLGIVPTVAGIARGVFANLY